MKSLKLENIGQIKKVSINFGDLTILVGNQATGKSTFLQTQKLIQDAGFIKNELNYYGYSYSDFSVFLSLYFGEGMNHAWDKNSKVSVDYKEINLEERVSKARNSYMKNFYVPSQRVMIMEQGFAKPFTSFDISYPFTLKEFSELIRLDLDRNFLHKTDVFPQPNKLKQELREVVSRHVFRDGKIQIESIGNKKQLVINIKDKKYSVGSWSAGQKEFAPLLFGLYWAIPASRVATRDKVSTITIEEPEMGLHPTAIVDTMLLIFELLARGYKVNLSTHSSTILELFWAINNLKKNKNKIDTEEKFLDIFHMKKTRDLKEFARKVLAKKFKIYYFKSEKNHKTVSVDISELENFESDEIADWGGITSFSDHVSEIVSSLYQG